MPALQDIAVVVPVGPGEGAWRELLPALTGVGEVVLCCIDGDPAADHALQASPGARLVTAPRGRAAQLNAGAKTTRSEWLWFLHADTRLDEGVLEHLARVPAGDYLGYFDLRFHDGPRLMLLNTLGAWFRSRVLGMPFGDQGLLLRRSLFERLGGFDEQLPAAEDHALVWAAKHAGVALRPLGAGLTTSARRYVEHGWWRVTARHLSLTWIQARAFSRRAG